MQIMELVLSVPASCVCVDVPLCNQHIAVANALRLALRRAAKVARERFPRGGAHTYASENADRYRALEDASEDIASAIEALVK